MNDAILRTRLIRLASEHPEFRKDLLPLIRSEKQAGMYDSHKVKQQVSDMLSKEFYDWSHFETLFREKGFDDKRVTDARVTVTSLKMDEEILDVTLDVTFGMNGVLTPKFLGGDAESGVFDCTFTLRGMHFDFDRETYPEFWA